VSKRVSLNQSIEACTCVHALLKNPALTHTCVHPHDKYRHHNLKMPYAYAGNDNRLGMLFLHGVLIVGNQCLLLEPVLIVGTSAYCFNQFYCWKPVLLLETSAIVGNQCYC